MDYKRDDKAGMAGEKEESSTDGNDNASLKTDGKKKSKKKKRLGRSTVVTKGSRMRKPNRNTIVGDE